MKFLSKSQAYKELSFTPNFKTRHEILDSRAFWRSASCTHLFLHKRMPPRLDLDYYVSARLLASEDSIISIDRVI